MIGVVPPLLLALAATSYDIRTTSLNTYSPSALQVNQGDTVRWQASSKHPLVFDDAPSVPYTTTQERTLDAPGVVAYHCAVHVSSGMAGTVSVNGLPTVAIVRETASPGAGQPVSFHATASDPDGTVARIDWDLDGDGSFERTGATAGAGFDAGTHTVRARAVDNLGASATASHTFAVAGAVGGGGGGGGGAPPGSYGDIRAPDLSAHWPKSVRIGKLRRRGVKLTLTASEDGRFVAVLANRTGRRLGRKTADALAGQRTVMRVRARRAKPGRLKLRIAAIDLAGNRTTIVRRLIASAPR